jgi:hypothetical protein
MNKRHVIISVFIIMLMLASSAHAFDRQRKGFVLSLGGGAGIATYKQKVSDYDYEIESDRESDLALFTNFEIGYAPTDQLMIMYSNVVPWFSFTNVFNEDLTLISGISGATVTYFVNPEAPSFFFGGGVGMAFWDAPFEEGFEAWTNVGLLGKLGYEIARSITVTFHILYGKPDTSDWGLKAETSALNLGVTVNWLAY